MTRQIVLLVVPAIVLMTLLGGCTAAPYPAPSESTTPTTTSVARQVKAPIVRVPITCGQLLTASVASTAVGEKVALAVGEAAVPTTAAMIAERQSGTLDCSWSPARADVSDPTSLSVEIAPDAATELTTRGLANAADATALISTHVGINTATFRCYGRLGRQLHCTAEMAVGSYWAEVSYAVSNASGVSLVTAETALSKLLGTVASRLSSSPSPTAAWVVPAAPLSNFCASPTRTSMIHSTFSNSNLEAAVIATSAGLSPATAMESAESFAECRWTAPGSNATNASDITVYLERGGSWALAALQAAQPRSAAGRFTRVNLGGKYPAVIASGATSTDAIIALGSNLAQVTVNTPDSAATRAALAALARDIERS
jgi:hypothetical protein